MKLEWLEKYAIGINSIDEQHKVLIELINQLSDSIITNNRNNISEALMGLVDYTMNHFLVEESIFEQIGYSETPGHKAEHDKFTGKIMSVLDSFEGGAELNSDIIPFLNDWLLHHILKVDKAYVPIFQQNSIT